jgi:hypothetical protein
VYTEWDNQCQLEVVVVPCNRAGWLRGVTKMPKTRLISRAHLPRLLAIMPLEELNDIVEAHFGVRLEVNDDDDLASDGSASQQVIEESVSATASRLALGQALLNCALQGSSIRFVRQRVIAVEKNGSGWRLHTANGHDCPPNFLVGADGVLSNSPAADCRVYPEAPPVPVRWLLRPGRTTRCTSLSDLC